MKLFTFQCVGMCFRDVMHAFDLDSVEADRPLWMGFLETIAPATFWTPFFSPEGYWDVTTRLRDVDTALGATFGVGLDQVHNAATAFFRRSYTHVRLYHGTRILDEQSYRDHGLRRSSIVQLNETAQRMFGCSEQLVRAISRLRADGYANHNQGYVGVWYSRRALLEYGSYCVKGSEYLQLLSRELGPDAHQRMTMAGRGAVICCRIPITEAEHFCARMAELAIKHLFRIINPNTNPRVYLEEDSPMLARDIPASWIDIEFIPDQV